jgi:hypothetical protein
MIISKKKSLNIINNNYNNFNQDINNQINKLNKFH